MTEKYPHVNGCQCNDCCSNNFLPTNICYTDVNNIYYKNHQLVMERIDNIENHLSKIALCDTETLVKENIENVFNHIKRLEEKIAHIEKSIKEIKTLFNPREQEVWKENLLIRLDAIEKIVKEIDRFQNITMMQYQQNKKKYAHKCPVCEGFGTIHMDYLCNQEDLLCGWKKDALGNAYKDCLSCEGKGIVWG